MRQQNIVDVLMLDWNVQIAAAVANPDASPAEIFTELGSSASTKPPGAYAFIRLRVAAGVDTRGF